MHFLLTICAHIMIYLYLISESIQVLGILLIPWLMSTKVKGKRDSTGSLKSLKRKEILDFFFKQFEVK